MSLEQIDTLLKKLSEVSSPVVDKTESTKGSYPFADKQKQYRGYSDAQLDYAVKDASDAAKAMKGHSAKGDPSAENWYRDDVATIRQEIERRRGKAKTESDSVEKLAELLRRLKEDGDAGFDAWMSKVDAEVKKISGMAVADLDDAPYRDWYEDDLSPSRAARRAIKNAGG
jgi:antirestriction protein